MVSLCWKLSEFPTNVLREAWNWPSHDHATEQAQSSDQSQSDIVYDDDCVDIVYDQISEWSGRLLDQHFYDEPALLLQKQLWDIISRNKEGLAKKKTFMEWCRRVHMHTEAASTASASTAAEHAEATSTATEHAESHCFKSLALGLLSNDPTPEKRRNAKYKICKNTKPG